MDLGKDNSRMKDFFDLDWLCRHMAFDLATLRAAVVATFARRGTALPDSVPVALSDEFSTDVTKVTQWNAFLRKNRLPGDPLPQIIARLHGFLMPVLHTPDARLHWPVGGGWRKA